MRIGVSLRSAYGPLDDARLGARWMIERARAARDAGLDSLFVGDHHNVGAPFRYYQNTPMLARLLAEWDERSAGALFLLPLWHPVLVAEQAFTLAAIARGRFVLQCAIGAGDMQFDAFGASLRTRPSRFEAALDVIRRLGAGETVTTDAPWRIREAHVAPPPEPVEVWIGAAATAAIERAARLGDAFLAGPEAVPADARRSLEEYRAACERHGRRPTTIAIRRDVHVAASDAEAEQVAGPVLARGYRGFDPAATIWGSVGRVADEIARLGEIGYTDVIVRHLADDHDAVLRSFARLGEVRARLAPAG